jgi:NAD(P)-dependent dehydrogenase (short-subunit alcohol dehydrogenase family)
VNASIIKRTGTSADLFGMIRYLTSDEAEWVTGQTFLVNGGYNTRL